MFLGGQQSSIPFTFLFAVLHTNANSFYIWYDCSACGMALSNCIDVFGSCFRGLYEWVLLGVEVDWSQGSLLMRFEIRLASAVCMVLSHGQQIESSKRILLQRPRTC